MDRPMKYSMMILSGCAALALSACDMQSESRISYSPIQVVRGQYNETVLASGVDRGTAQAVADHYERHGNGPVDITITYGSGKKESSAMSEARRIAELLRSEGVNDIEMDVLPLADPDAPTQAMISYNQVTAHPPVDCGVHPADSRKDLAGSNDGRFETYRFGCGIDTYMAQQVARPRDLLGSTRDDPASADRYGSILKDYRDGKDRKDLKGQTASETKL